MGAILDALHRLQEVERQINALRRKTEAKYRQVELQQRQIDGKADTVQAKENERRAKQMEFDRFELESQIHQASINKHKEALNKAKTNKEYATILTAINTERADNSKHETRQLELLAELDVLKREVAELEGKSDTHRTQLATAQQQYQDFLSATAAERERLNQQREQFAAGVPPAVRSVFERVAERHDGEAMAELVRLHPKRDEFACGGCNMTLTREHVNALRTRDEIQICSTCGRILHLSADVFGGR